MFWMHAKLVTLYFIFHNLKKSIKVQAKTITSQPPRFNSIIHFSSSSAYCLVNCSEHSVAQSFFWFLTLVHWKAVLTPEFTILADKICHYTYVYKDQITCASFLINTICILQILPPKNKHFIWFMAIGWRRSLNIKFSIFSCKDAFTRHSGSSSPWSKKVI